MWRHTSLSLLFAGCGYEAPVVLLPDEATAMREMAVLALVNDTTVTAEELDHGVKLDVRASKLIIERRPFASFEELDAVPYVGPASIDKLYAYAVDHGYLAAYEPGPSIPDRSDVLFDRNVLAAVLEEVR